MAEEKTLQKGYKSLTQKEKWCKYKNTKGKTAQLYQNQHTAAQDVTDSDKKRIQKHGFCTVVKMCK